MIADSTTIDGTTQPGYTPSTPQIEIDGRAVKGDGLVVAGGGSTIKGLVFNGFVGDTAVVFKADSSRIDGSFIGPDMNGMRARRKNSIGIEVVSSGNHIGGDLGNVISGNSIGIQIGNATRTSMGNEIDHNLIGTDPDGLRKVPNKTGILILNGRQNLVGISDPNVISGNGIGIRIAKRGSLNNILDNRIGTDASGTAPLGNTTGVRIQGDSNELGLVHYGEANEMAAPNTISGNVVGVGIEGSAADHNMITYNFIGTGGSGLRDAGGSGIPNRTGIRIVDSSDNSIGRDVQFNNVIAGNNGNGIEIVARDAIPLRNAINGNSIGIDRNSDPLGNDGNGIFVTGADATVIGGAATNLVGSNGLAGIRLQAADGSVIENNRIGVTFTTAIGNGGPGLVLTGSSEENLIGESAGNVIGGNSGPGVLIESASNGNVLRANHIGTRPSSEGPALDSLIPNGGGGIRITGTARKRTTGNRIGTPEGPRNVISDNSTWGVVFEGAGAFNNTVQNNWIGLSSDGTRAAPNGAGGILLDGTPGNLIGGGPGEGNVISGNGFGAITAEMSGDGILLRGGEGSSVTGNRIGTGPSGASAIANKGNGVTILDGTSNRIGGPSSGQGNLISGNLGDGVLVDGSSSQLNGISGNRIGVDEAGSSPLPNGGNGIQIEAGYGTVVGGTTSSETNVISGNTGSGVLVGAALRTSIQGNHIGTGISATTSVPNDVGVSVTSAGDVIVGGAQQGRNVIAFNTYGVVVDQNGGPVSIRYNEIRDNEQLGIDLGLDGVTPNDDFDVDIGANGLQNYPVLGPISTNGSALVMLNSIPNTTFVIDVYSNAACDPSRFGEGHIHIGSGTVETDASGYGETHVLGMNFGGRNWVSATATSSEGATSEFSQCEDVGPSR